MKQGSKLFGLVEQIHRDGGEANFLVDLTGVFPYGQIVVFLYPLLITYGIFLPEIRIRV